MNGIENFLVIAGISADIFAGMECEGSLVARVDKKHLSTVCVLLVGWQLAALFAGNYLAGLLYGKEFTGEKRYIGLVLAAVIYFCLGLRLLVKAVKNERVLERREDHPGIKRFVSMAAAAGVYTLFAGIAFGFLRTSLSAMLVMISLLTLAAVIAGMYAGYRQGFVHIAKAYLCGTVLLWAAGADVILRHIAVS